LLGGVNKRGNVFSARSANQQLSSNRGIVFSVRSMQRYWSNVLVVGQSPAGKNVSTKAEDIVGFRHQATMVKTADLRDVVNCR
jgi:hypothetical protein